MLVVHAACITEALQTDNSEELPMETQRSYRPLFIGVLMALFLMAAVAPYGAQAGIVSTGEIVSEQQMDAQRDHLKQQLSRSEVQSQLEQFGVDPEQAHERVAAMTDAEVLELSEGVDQFLAGGDVGVTTLLLLIILFILVT